MTIETVPRPAVRHDWACPDATQLLRADTSRAEWLRTRRAGLGGSDASTVAQVNPYASWYTLWLDKTGRAQPEPDTDATEWGRRLEPVISQWFTDTTGIPVRRCGLLAAKQRPWQRYSPDGLAGCGGLCEWKTTMWRTNDAAVWLDGEVPDHAEVQVQHGMAVTGRSHAHVAVLIDGRTPLHRMIQRDDELIATLGRLEQQFWHEHVLADVAPPVDGSAATTAALRTRYSPATHDTISAGAEVDELIAAREHAKTTERDAAAEVAAYDNRLRAVFEHADQLAVQGMVRATLHQNGAFSPKAFTRDHPQLAEQYRTSKPAIDTDRLAAEQPELHRTYRARVLRIPKHPKPVEGDQ